MSQQPYFDSRSLLAMGMPQHTVEALKEAFNRTGGQTNVEIDLDDFQAILLGAQDAADQIDRLKSLVSSLQRQLLTIEVPDISRLQKKVEIIEARLNNLTEYDDSALKSKISTLEAVLYGKL